MSSSSSRFSIDSKIDSQIGTKMILLLMLMIIFRCRELEGIQTLLLVAMALVSQATKN